ncbi:AAA ATPase central domain protein [Thermodesulfatator indicus DSM 15286]|uniref:Replication-associated recombination protein A n=1 Tax=Thermodesulfatator indicus (strain DSM 15286 / JCM 11887 / CIR29812) TaxID=667014 RepID=F8AA64_THEID|nr:replication-associated recombination protein A [Thermodesulfatator indicus]AEH45355.1 AAA ATPase central domain protein [Thermodesulfatator indicus DSM 15286]
MKSLFEPQRPLAERLRPQKISDFVGQKHILGPNKFLTLCLAKKKVPSLILWGPPGCGKTTLARLIAKETKTEFVPISAVDAGIKELRKAIDLADKGCSLGRQTLLFIDEIHRFNKAQQDFLLPYVEEGKIILIGATTENPSFRVIAPLLSRVRVFVLKALSKKELLLILKRALKDPRGLGNKNILVEEEVLEYLAEFAQGDARLALNFLEDLVMNLDEGQPKLTLDIVKELELKKPLLYDQSGEEHYNLLSAFHKSLRGSDPDAAIYWMVRMIEAGEDPLVIVRRLVAAAAEDVGLADPKALQMALAAKDVVEFLGLPEGELALAQAVIYVALAPKSNSAYQALNRAREDVQKYGALPVPLHLRNPETKFMRNIGYGKDYKYPHNFQEGFVPQDYLPEELKDRRYYFPTERGQEKELKERLGMLKTKKGKN